MNERNETLFVVDRPAGVEWVPGKGAREQPLWPEHAAFMDDLFERGLIALGGPFLDGSGAMVVMRVPDERTAREGSARTRGAATAVTSRGSAGSGPGRSSSTDAEPLAVTFTSSHLGVTAR